MDTSKETILQGLYKPHIIVERKKRRIGIIGLITPDTKVCGDELCFQIRGTRDYDIRNVTEISGVSK